MKRFFYNFFYKSPPKKIFLSLICSLYWAIWGLCHSIIYENNKGIIIFVVLIVFYIVVTIVRAILSLKYKLDNQ